MSVYNFKNKKIAILTPTFYDFSGVDRVVELQAEEFSKKGNKVTVFAFKGNLRPKNYSVYYFGFTNNPTLERVMRLVFFISPQIKKYARELRNFDIIISHLYPMNLIARHAKKKYKIKYIFHNHGVATPSLFPKLSERIYLNLFNYFTNKSIKNVDATVSISDYLRRVLLKETGINSEIVYDKIDKRKFNKKTKGKKAILQKHNLTKKDKICLYVGRISPHKGLHILIRAFNLAKKRNPNLKLLIVGKPTFDTYFKQLKRLAKEDVVFCGIIPDKDVPKYYAACDIFTTATLWEGFNLTVVEANSCGKPVVAFDVGPHKEVVKKGILVKPKDIKGFAEAILSLS